LPRFPISVGTRSSSYPSRWHGARVTGIWGHFFEPRRKHSSMPCWKDWEVLPGPACNDLVTVSGSAPLDWAFPGSMFGWIAGRSTTNTSLTGQSERVQLPVGILTRDALEKTQPTCLYGIRQAGMGPRSYQSLDHRADNSRTQWPVVQEAR